jgi:putative peptide zinc metalloprotease protein
MLAIHPLDTRSAGEGVTFVGGVPVRLSPASVRLLTLVESGASFEQLAAAACRGGRSVTAGEVEGAYRRLRRRIDTLGAAAPAHRRQPAALWARRRLLAGCWVGRLVAPLAPLFSLAVALPLLLLTGVLVTALLAGVAGSVAGSGTSGAALGAGSWLVAYALFTLSLLLHELGHAAAARRFGAEPGEIGCGFYLLFPAFYCDVTAAWSLRRGRRAVVDLGGIYFQLLTAGVLAAFALTTGAAACSLAVYMILAVCLWNLLPFFHLDGQWLLADLAGIPELAQAPTRLLRRRGRSGGRGIEGAALERYPAALRWGLSLYALLALTAWGGMAVLLVARLTGGLHLAASGSFGLARSLFTVTLALLPVLALTLPWLRRRAPGIRPDDPQEGV